MGSTAAQRAATDLDPFMQMVESTVDLKAVENHEFLIKADFDERLKGRWMDGRCHTRQSRGLTRWPFFFLWGAVAHRLACVDAVAFEKDTANTRRGTVPAHATTQGSETETEGGGWSRPDQVGHEIGLDPNKKLKMENSSQYGYYLRIARAVPSVALSSRARTGACGP